MWPLAIIHSGCFSQLCPHQTQLDVHEVHKPAMYTPGFLKHTFIVAQSLSRVWLFASLWTAAPGLSVLHYLLGFAQVHVHWISDAIQLSHPLPPSSPSAFNLFQPSESSNEPAVHIRWPSTGASASASWITALSWQRGLHNLMKLWAMPCRATQNG